MVRQINSVLFDLDGTLVDSACMVAKALDTLCEERGAPPIEVEAVRGWISLGAESLVASALGPFATDAPRDLARMRALLSAVPADMQDIYSGVSAALERLSGADVRLAVVTNKPQALSEQLLEGLALAKWFGAIIGGDSAPFSKPHPASLRMALAAIGGDAASACLVGDSIVDAEAAAALEIPFFLYGRGYGAAGCPKHLVAGRFTDFAELPMLLKLQRA